MTNPSRSISTSTGIAPARSIAATVATAVCDTVKTRSPAPIPQARSASSIASVPLAQPIPCATPIAAAKAASNASTSAPPIYQPLSSTRLIAASMLSRCAKYEARGSVCGIDVIRVSHVEQHPGAVIGERPGQPLGEADARLPAGQRAKLAVVGDEVADIDLFPLRRKFAHFVVAGAIGADQRGGDLDEAVGRVAADIERQPFGLRRHRGGEKGLDRVVDIDHVPPLLAAPDLEWLSFDRKTQPDAEEILARILDPHSRAIDVGQAQRAALDPVDVAEQQVVALAGDLVDAVDVGRTQRVRLVDREVLRPAVDLPRARMDDRYLGRDRAAGFQQVKLGGRVDREIV